MPMRRLLQVLALDRLAWNSWLKRRISSPTLRIHHIQTFLWFRLAHFHLSIDVTRLPRARTTWLSAPLVYILGVPE
jgi:hypothetical protein